MFYFVRAEREFFDGDAPERGEESEGEDLHDEPDRADMRVVGVHALQVSVLGVVLGKKEVVHRERTKVDVSARKPK